MIRRMIGNCFGWILSSLGFVRHVAQRGAQVLPADETALTSSLDSIRSLVSQGDIESALDCLDQVAQQFPGHRAVLTIAFDLNFSVGRWIEAGRACRELLAGFGPSADVLCAAGLCEIKQSRWLTAFEFMERAIALDRTHLASMHNAGLCALRFGELSSAKTRLQAAVELDPEHFEVRLNLGVCLKKLREFSAARHHLDMARKSAPDEPRVLSEYCDLLLETCSWRELSDATVALRSLLESQLRNGTLPGVSPYTALCLYEDTSFCRRIADAYAQSYLKPPATGGFPPYNADTRRLRVAYLSADFNSHAVGYLFSRFAAFHDRSKVEVFCFYMRSVEDSVTERIRHTVEHFIGVEEVGDGDVAGMLRNCQIDVLVDMGGYTAHSRPAILGMRPAPVQCQMLGYPGSMGKGLVDFFVGTAAWIPEKLDAGFSERVHKLARTPLAIEEFDPYPSPLRAEFALDTEIFVFTNMSRSYRICAKVFAMWMTILERCPHSILWLTGESEESKHNLIKAAERASVDPGRINFYCGKAKLSEDWRHACADVWLDTLVFSSGTAAALNVWAELPMVTMIGSTPQSRTGYALLSGAGLGQYAASDSEEYIALACRLYGDRQFLDDFRADLRSAKLCSPLFDPKNFVVELEAVFLEENVQAQR